MKLKTRELIKSNYQQIIFVFLAFLTMVLVSHIYTSRIVSDQILNIGEESMNTIQTAVTANLSETKLTFSNMIQTSESMLATGKSNEEILVFLTGVTDYFSGSRSPLPDFMKVYGYIRGEFLDGSGWEPPADYKPAARPWYIGANKNSGEIFFSDPYIDAETGSTVISYSQQLFDENGVMQGILAIDLNMTRITDYVENQKLSNDGYGMMLNSSLIITAHPNDEFVGKKITEIGGEYKNISKILNNGETISAYRFKDTDGTDSIAFFRPIFDEWYIGIVTSRSSYYEPVYILALVLSILGITLMCALSYILLRTTAEKMRSDEESRSKSSFLARMSHEIRTPMNAIIGMTDIAKKTDDMSKIQNCIVTINDASNHLLGVINDILDMSKIEADKLELSETEFLFEDMLRQVTNVVKFKLEEKHQRLLINLDQNIPDSIITDQQRLSQVITNLLSNAIKFTPENGKISLNTYYRIENNAHILQFEVIDNGIGISKEDQQRLFTPFEQADGSISRKFGGTGLGLAISKKIVESMGGEISVESDLTMGSKFIFHIVFIPCVSKKADMALEDIDLSNVRILVIDKDRNNREYFKNIASKSGFTCLTASNGRSGFQILADEKIFDMIFISKDDNDPDCISMIRKMREYCKNNLPIILMSQDQWSKEEEASMKPYTDQLIIKPFFQSTIIECIQEYTTRDELSEEVFAQEVEQDEGPIFTGKHILLAEDVEVNQLIFTTQLLETGVEIDCADNGQIACDMFLENNDKYDMIFMDIHMPELDGYDATKKIREMNVPNAKDIPIVAISADVFREDVEKSKSYGMNDHIGKPFKLEEVIEKMKKYMNIS